MDTSPVGRHLPEVRDGRHGVEASMTRLLTLLLGALLGAVAAVVLCGVGGWR